MHDVHEEVVRIQEINTLRKTADVQLESGQALEWLLGKGDNTLFHRDQSDSEYSGESEEKSQEAVNGEEFGDIMRIKRKVAFDESLVSSIKNLVKVEAQTLEDSKPKVKGQPRPSVDVTLSFHSARPPASPALPSATQPDFPSAPQPTHPSVPQPALSHAPQPVLATKRRTRATL